MIIAGVDEVGRGPLAGPVVVAAVVLDPARPILGLADSKKLSEKKREQLALEIREKALYWALGRAEVEEIDEINILHATMRSMTRAVAALPVYPDKVLVDGNRIPELRCQAEAIVKGDSKISEISAAAILAKVTRDAEMVAMHQEFPQYGFDRHKGYPTKEHQQALARYGATQHHRRSFAPVARAIGAQS